MLIDDFYDVFFPSYNRYRQDGETESAFVRRVFKVFENLHPRPPYRGGWILIRPLLLLAYTLAVGFTWGLWFGFWGGVATMFLTAWTMIGTALLLNRPPPIEDPNVFGRFANRLGDGLEKILEKQLKGRKNRDG